MDSASGKIGFFDSGLGGLIVLKAVAKLLPAYDYEFFGDTANVPYGDKTEVEIYNLTEAGMRHLFERGCELIIIACNTASAETLRKLQDTFLQEEYPDRKILGVIIPMVEAVVEATSRKALLIGTKRTIESGKYDREFAKFANPPQVTAVATPQLVPFIESGIYDKAVLSIKSLLDDSVAQGIDSVILGCTHYALLKQQIGEVCGVKVTLFSPDDIIPKKVEAYLEAHPEIEIKLSRSSTRNIYLSEHRPDYDKIAGDMLGGVFLFQ